MEGKTKKETVTEPAVKNEVETEPIIKKASVILKNTSGKLMEEKDYFFEGEAFPGFQKACGFPVDREDLLDIFNKIFNKEDNILFYKTSNKEVYIIIIPLKYSSTVGSENGSVKGDCQKHAISFIGEGSVNTETLKTKLKKIIPFIKYKDR